MQQHSWDGVNIPFTREEWNHIYRELTYGLEYYAQDESYDLHGILANIIDRIEKNLGVE